MITPIKTLMLELNEDEIEYAKAMCDSLLDSTSTVGLFCAVMAPVDPPEMAVLLYTAKDRGEVSAAFEVLKLSCEDEGDEGGVDICERLSVAVIHPSKAAAGEG